MRMIICGEALPAAFSGDASGRTLSRSRGSLVVGKLSRSRGDAAGDGRARTRGVPNDAARIGFAGARRTRPHPPEPCITAMSASGVREVWRWTRHERAFRGWNLPRARFQCDVSGGFTPRLPATITYQAEKNQSTAVRAVRTWWDLVESTSGGELSLFRRDGTYGYSPSDLIVFMESEFASWMDTDK